VNALFRWSEQKFAILGIMFYSELLDFTSLSVHSDAGKRALAVTNPLLPLIMLLQYGLFAVTLVLLLLHCQKAIVTALRDPFVWSMMGLALLSPLWSDFPDVSFRFSLFTLGPALFGLYLATRFPLRQQLKLLAWALALVAFISLLFSLGMPGAAIETGANAGAWRGPFVQKNIMGRVMVLAVLVLLSARQCFPPGYKRWIMWSGIVVSLGLVVLSNSKSSLLILVILLALRPLFSTLRWSGSQVIPLMIILLMVGGSAGIWAVNHYEAIVLGLGKDPSLSGRVDIWEAVIQKILERPWFGYGYSAFWLEDGGAADVWQAVGDKPPHSHNGFLNFGAEFGLVGLAVFCFSLLFFWLKSFHYVRLNRGIEGLLPAVYVTFLLLFNQTESTIISFRSLFWMLHFSLSLSIPLFVVRRVPAISAGSGSDSDASPPINSAQPS
jgi:exopolysaccharide production protein ExoQ